MVMTAGVWAQDDEMMSWLSYWQLRSKYTEAEGLSKYDGTPARVLCRVARYWPWNIMGATLSGGFVIWFLKHVTIHRSRFSVSVKSTHHQHTCYVRNICAVPNISQLNSANLKSSQSEQWKLCLLLDGDKWHPVIIMNFKTNFILCFPWLHILICSEMISYLYQNHT